MSNLKSSNLLMACLLSAKASLLLVAPVQSAISSSPSENSVNSSVEVEIINLTVNSAELSQQPMLVADTDVDRNQDRNQDRNRDADRNRTPVDIT